MSEPLMKLFNDPSRKESVVRDCLDLLDREVATKKGFSGTAIKAAYHTVKGVKPGFLRDVVGHLLPEFAEALQPMYDEAVSASVEIPAFFKGQEGRIADALLGVTDRRAEASKHGIVKKTYQRLRGGAKTHVEAAMPGIGRLVEKHVANP